MITRKDNKGKLLCLLFCLFFMPGIQGQEIIDEWQVFNTDNSSIPDDHICDIKMDSKKMLWIATWKGGIAKFENNIWKAYNPSNSGLSSFSVNEIAFDQNDHLWIGTNRGGMVYFDRENWQTIQIPGYTVTAINVSKKGDKLIGTPKHGLFLYDKTGHLTKLWGYDESIDNAVHHITFDNRGDALVSTSKGLLKFKKTYMGGFTTVFEILRREHTLKAEMDRKGQIWANDFETGHLFRYKNGKWEELKNTARNIYIALNGESHDYTVNDFTIFENDRIVLGTRYFGGLATCTSKDRWGPIFPPFAGYSLDGGVKCLLEAENESIWVGTVHKGLMIPIKFEEEEEPDSTLVIDEERVRKTREREARTFTQQRKITVKDTVYAESEVVELMVWDGQKPDGDIITLIFNGDFLLRDYEVTKHPKHIRLVIDPDKENRLVMYAHNTGNVPPNTARLSILRLNGQEEIELKSDLVNAEAVIFINDVLKRMKVKEVKLDKE